MTAISCNSLSLAVAVGPSYQDPLPLEKVFAAPVSVDAFPGSLYDPASFDWAQAY